MRAVKALMLSALAVLAAPLPACAGGGALSQLPPAEEVRAPLAPAPSAGAAPAAPWRKLLVEAGKPAKEPLLWSALPEGVSYDPASCGAPAEYRINFTQKAAGVQAARAELSLSFDSGCSYSDGGAHISGVKVKALKASALPLKQINAAAELPPTSVSNCAVPGAPLMACADIVLSFSVSPAAGSWAYYSETYTLRGDGVFMTRTGETVAPGGAAEIVR